MKPLTALNITLKIFVLRTVPVKLWFQRSSEILSPNEENSSLSMPDLKRIPYAAATEEGQKRRQDSNFLPTVRQNM